MARTKRPTKADRSVKDKKDLDEVQRVDGAGTAAAVATGATDLIDEAGKQSDVDESFAERQIDVLDGEDGADDSLIEDGSDATGGRSSAADRLREGGSVVGGATETLDSMADRFSAADGSTGAATTTAAGTQWVDGEVVQTPGSRAVSDAFGGSKAYEKEMTDQAQQVYDDLHPAGEAAADPPAGGSSSGGGTGSGSGTGTGTGSGSSNIHEAYDDGSSEEGETPTQGSSTVVTEDGTIITTYDDGTQETNYPDGTVETDYPDGTVKTEYGDGSTETIHPDGTTTTTPPVDPPPADEEAEEDPPPADEEADATSDGGTPEEDAYNKGQREKLGGLHDDGIDKGPAWGSGDIDPSEQELIGARVGVVESSSARGESLFGNPTGVEASAGGPPTDGGTWNSDAGAIDMGPDGEAPGGPQRDDDPFDNNSHATVEPRRQETEDDTSEDDAGSYVRDLRYEGTDDELDLAELELDDGT